MSRESRFIQAYPNPEIDHDKRKVTIAVVFLWVVAVLAIMGGLYMASNLSGSGTAWIGWVAAGTGAIYALCALAIQLRHSTTATAIAGTLVALNLLGAFLSMNLFSIAINVAFLVVIFQAHRSLRSIKMRVALSDQDNPLVAYYHALVPLVVEVMKADGRIDPAEIAQFNSMCDKMHISDMERKLLMDKAMQANEPISVLVPRFLDAAGALGIQDPPSHLIQALLVMAAADRHLHPEEKQVLRKAAVVARYDEIALERQLKQLETQIQTLSRQDALATLGLTEGAGADQIEAAYRQLRAAANPEDYLHLGQAVVQKVEERRNLLDQAHALLLGQPG